VLHLATVAGEDSGEEWMTVAYMEETAKQAGLRTVPVAVEDLGWDSTYGRLVDAENRRCSTASSSIRGRTCSPTASAG
jgi:glutathionylspermidine synthase